MFETTAVFLSGAAIYGTIEMLSRGWTHWSMLLAGGICMTIMYHIANRAHYPIWQKWVLSAAVITTVEFLLGVFFNMHLNWHIWDYSSRAYNLLGQICPAYSCIWLALSVPGIWICGKLYSLLHQ
jgi:uncharacterized membrane protein